MEDGFQYKDYPWFISESDFFAKSKMDEKTAILSQQGILTLISDNAEYELTRYDPASHTSSLVNGIRTTAFYASRSVICYSNLEDNGYLYFADLSGENIKKVTDVFSENMQVRGEWIYYSDQNDGMRLYRIRMNGQNRELLCADPVFFYTLLEESTDILVVGEPNNPNENVGLYHLDTLTGKLSTLESSWYE